MKSRSKIFATVIALPLIAASLAQARTDHMRCYQMKDPLNLAAVADLSSELGLDPGCTVSKAKQFCEQSDSDVVSATEKKTGLALTLLPISGPDNSTDRICYKVKCPAPAVAIGDQDVSDTFGTRTLSGLKSSLLCTPAVKGAYQPSLTVSYRIDFDSAPGMPDLPAVEFEGGEGLGAIRTVGKHKGDYLPSHTRSGQVAIGDAHLVGGAVVTGNTDALGVWYEAVKVAGAYCAAHDGDECDSHWIASGLGRSATLSEIAEGGEILASWQLADAWPAGLTLADPDGTGTSTGIIRMTLSAAVEQFSFGTGTSVVALFDGVAPPAAVTPVATDGETALETFLARYHDLDGTLLRLNGLQLLAGTTEPPSPPLARQPHFAGTASSFRLEIDGVISGGFKEVTGLESEIEIIEYRDGDDPITHKRPGNTTTTHVAFRRGTVNDASLLEWSREVLSGVTDRKSGSIVYLDRDGDEVMTFTMTEAWPCRWKAPELNSSSDTHIVEEIEFVVEKVERA